MSDIGLPSDMRSSDSFLIRSGMAAMMCSASVNTLASLSPAVQRDLKIVRNGVDQLVEAKCYIKYRYVLKERRVINRTRTGIHFYTKTCEIQKARRQKSTK